MSDDFVPVDATPHYLWDYEGWEAIPGNRNLAEPKFILADTLYHINPNLKLIVIVRNPASRWAAGHRLFCLSMENVTM